MHEAGGNWYCESGRAVSSRGVPASRAPPAVAVVRFPQQLLSSFPG